jgi:hypothetical protein
VITYIQELLMSTDTEKSQAVPFLIAGGAAILLFLLWPLIKSLFRVGDAVADVVTEAVDTLQDIKNFTIRVLSGPVTFTSDSPGEEFAKMAARVLMGDPTATLICMTFCPDMKGRLKPGDHLYMDFMSIDGPTQTAILKWRIGNGPARESLFDWHRQWYSWPIRHAGDPVWRITCLDWDWISSKTPWPPSFIRASLGMMAEHGSVLWCHGTQRWAGILPPPIVAEGLKPELSTNYIAVPV